MTGYLFRCPDCGTVAPLAPPDGRMRRWRHRCAGCGREWGVATGAVGFRGDWSPTVGYGAPRRRDPVAPVAPGSVR